MLDRLARRCRGLAAQTLTIQGRLSAIAARDGIVTASGYLALQKQSKNVSACYRYLRGVPDGGRAVMGPSILEWCSDGFEIGLDTTERVCVALTCCGWEAIAHVATSRDPKRQYVQDLINTVVENHFGRINAVLKPIEWVTDNGSCIIAAATNSMLLEIGAEPCSTPVCSPRSNGMADAFAKTFKRAYVSVNSIAKAKTDIAHKLDYFGVWCWKMNITN